MNESTGRFNSSTLGDMETHGFAIVPGLLSVDEIARLIQLVSLHTAENDSARSRAGQTYAIRNLFSEVPAIRTLAESGPLKELAMFILGGSATPVKATLFDKTETANWKVPWHQDVTIAVDRRADLAGFGPWTEKAGVIHVQPPAEILENMIALRLHLDNCDATNGTLLVLPGSHGEGRLRDEGIERWKGVAAPVTCSANAGDVLAMRPLLVHASASSTASAPRRVVHIEYAGGTLPGGLHWA